MNAHASIIRLSDPDHTCESVELWDLEAELEALRREQANRIPPPSHVATCNHCGGTGRSSSHFDYARGKLVHEFCSYCDGRG